MAQQRHILICGRNAELLGTRGLVLESAGYRVSVTLQPIEKAPDLDSVRLLIVCHTLSAAERQLALATLAERTLGAKALCLVPNSGANAGGIPTLDSFAGPRKMLEVVNQLLSS